MLDLVALDYVLYIALGSQIIIDLMERISYQRKVIALTSSSCGRAVIGKVLQVNMARINPRPWHESFWAWLLGLVMAKNWF